MAMQSMRQTILDSLDALSEVGYPLESASLVLAAAPFVPGPDLLPAAIVPPTFTGYAQVDALVFSAAFQAPDGTYMRSAPDAVFIRTGGAIDDVIYGFALMNALRTELYYAEAFDEPVSLTEVGMGVEVNPVVAFGV